MDADEIQKKRADAKAKQQQENYQKSIADLATNVSELLNSLEKTGARKLDADFIQAVRQLSTIASSLGDVRVNGDIEMKRVLTLLIGAIKNIDAAPIVQVAPTPVNVTETKIDLSPVTGAIKSLTEQMKPREATPDYSTVTNAVNEVTIAIKELSFPVPNYVLPFKDSGGKAAQVQLDASGNVPVAGTISVDTTGLATSARQDTGNTSLSSIDGKITTVNTGAVVISSSALPSGASTAAKQPALGTAGSASTDVITVQGIASMTALKTDGSAVVQPVSGTFWQATQPVSLASVPSHAVTNAGTFAVQAAQSGNWTTRMVGNAGATLDSTVGAGTAPTNQMVTGAIYNSTEISPTNGQAFAIQADSKGRQRMVMMDAAGNTRGANVNASNELSVTIGSVSATNISTNLAQVNGATTLAGNGASGTGAQRVTIASDSTGQVAPAANATATGTAIYNNTALSSTKQAANASAGNLYGYHIYNPNSVVIYVQMFNLASASVTVGTTAPTAVIAVPPLGWADATPGVPIAFGTALTIAATTTSTGSGTPTTGLLTNLWYK